MSIRTISTGSASAPDGPGSATCGKQLWVFAAVVVLAGAQASVSTAAGPSSRPKTSKETKTLNTIEKGFVEIRNPKSLGAARIPVERVYLGKYYKPNIALMPDGEMLLTVFHTNSHQVRENYREDILLFRSTDSGRSWSPVDNLGQRVNMLGREPYLTILHDRTILITCHFLPNEERNDLGYTANFVHRSADGGRI